MKKFEWARVRHTNGTQTLSLLEVGTAPDSNETRQFWASIRLFPHTRGTDYEFVAYNKNRILQSPVPSGAKTVEEAQEAIEKFLMDEDVIEDGDIVDELGQRECHRCIGKGYFMIGSDEIRCPDCDSKGYIS